MNWYYAEGGQQIGPVSDEQLQVLLREGKVSEETLVWCEGMADWSPYRDAKPAKSAPRQSRLADPIAAPAAFEVVKPSAVCAECGRMFDLEEMIPHKDVHVCAQCKPAFMRKLMEGVDVDSNAVGGMPYAGFWIRLAAKLLDNLILIVLVLVPALILIFLFAGGRTPRGGAGGAELMANLVGVFAQLSFMAVNCAYTIFFLGKFGATPGKMICKLKVVGGGGERIGYGRATGRFFAEILSGLICNIGYIIAAFDGQKRALHDHLCNTRVVYNRR